MTKYYTYILNFNAINVAYNVFRSVYIYPHLMPDVKTGFETCIKEMQKEIEYNRMSGSLIHEAYGFIFINKEDYLTCGIRTDKFVDIKEYPDFYLITKVDSYSDFHIGKFDKPQEDE